MLRRLVSPVYVTFKEYYRLKNINMHLCHVDLCVQLVNIIFSNVDYIRMSLHSSIHSLFTVLYIQDVLDCLAVQ